MRIKAFSLIKMTPPPFFFGNYSVKIMLLMSFCCQGLDDGADPRPVMANKMNNRNIIKELKKTKTKTVRKKTAVEVVSTGFGAKRE